MQLIKPYVNALMRIGVCNKDAGNVFGQNLWCFRLPGRRRPTHFPGPWNFPGRCRQRCLLLTPPPSSRLPVGWLRSDSPCGFGSAHIPVLLARPHLSIVNHNPSGTRFSLMGSQNSHKKTSWWEVFVAVSKLQSVFIDSCHWGPRSLSRSCPS